MKSFSRSPGLPVSPSSSPPAKNCRLTFAAEAHRTGVNLGRRAPKKGAFWRTLGDPAKCAKTRGVLAHARELFRDFAAPLPEKSSRESGHSRQNVPRILSIGFAVAHDRIGRCFASSAMAQHSPISIAPCYSRRAGRHCPAWVDVPSTPRFGRPPRMTGSRSWRASSRPSDMIGIDRPGIHVANEAATSIAGRHDQLCKRPTSNCITRLGCELDGRRRGDSMGCGVVGRGRTSYSTGVSQIAVG